MFKRIIVILVLVYTGLLFAQGDRGIEGEIILETINAVYETYKFEIKPVPGKTTWCQDVYNNWFIVTSATTSSVEITGNVCYDYNYVFFVCYQGSTPKFWLTLNEFTIYKLDEWSEWEEIISFYMDYRDCNYGLGGPQGGGSRDISILVNGADDKVYYEPEGVAGACTTAAYIEIDDDTLNIWEVNDFTGSHDISCMCADPVLISVTNYGNNPKVFWSHDDDLVLPTKSRHIN